MLLWGVSTFPVANGYPAARSIFAWLSVFFLALATMPALQHAL
jgi:hypothetical protein